MRHSRPQKRGGWSSASKALRAKHGRLDLAESELGVLSSQRLDRRIADKHTLSEEIAAWEEDPNANHAKADWQFTIDNARLKLKAPVPVN